MVRPKGSTIVSKCRCMIGPNVPNLTSSQPRGYHSEAVLVFPFKFPKYAWKFTHLAVFTAGVLTSVCMSMQGQVLCSNAFKFAKYAWKQGGSGIGKKDPGSISDADCAGKLKFQYFSWMYGQSSEMEKHEYARSVLCST